MIEGLIIRRATEQDVDLIVDTWRACYGSRFWGDRAVRMGDFKAGHRLVMARALTIGFAVVAAKEDAPHVVIGWAVGSPGVLHYVYVKRGFRGDGVARELTKELGCDEGPVTVTHLTKPIEKWRREREVRFNPYVLVT